MWATSWMLWMSSCPWPTAVVPVSMRCGIDSSEQPQSALIPPEVSARSASGALLIESHGDHELSLPSKVQVSSQESTWVTVSIWSWRWNSCPLLSLKSACALQHCHPPQGSPVLVPNVSLKIRTWRVEMGRQELIRAQGWLPSNPHSIDTHKHSSRCLCQPHVLEKCCTGKVMCKWSST